MLKLFHARGTRSVRVLWMLEEMELDYTIEPVAFPPRRNRAYLAINPAATLPALADGDVVLTESVAILQYLAGRYGPTPLAVAPDSPFYASYLQFLVLGEAGLSAPLNGIVGTRWLAPDDQKSNFTTELIARGFFQRLRLVEAQLIKSPYLAGDQFTAADISAGYAVGMGVAVLGCEDRLAPQIVEWRARLLEREGWKRAAAR